MIAGFLSLLLLQYLAYRVFEDWSFLRFLLTGWPFVMLGVAAVALALARPERPLTSLLVSAVVVSLGIQGLQHARTSNLFGIWHEHRRSVEVARLLSKELPATSVIYSLQHSGSLRHYGGLTTLRMDLLAPGWLDRSVAWLRTRGIPATFLLEDGEVELFTQRHAGQSLAGTLDARLALLYDGPTSRSRLYRSERAAVPGAACRRRRESEGIAFCPTRSSRVRSAAGSRTSTSAVGSTAGRR